MTPSQELAVIGCIVIAAVVIIWRWVRSDMESGDTEEKIDQVNGQVWLSKKNSAPRGGKND